MHVCVCVCVGKVCMCVCVGKVCVCVCVCACVCVGKVCMCMCARQCVRLCACVSARLSVDKMVTGVYLYIYRGFGYQKGNLPPGLQLL